MLPAKIVKISLFRHREPYACRITLAVHHGEGMFSRGGGQAEFVEETGFPYKTLVQMPPEGGVGAVVCHAEDHSFHFA